MEKEEKKPSVHFEASPGHSTRTTSLDLIKSLGPQKAALQEQLVLVDTLLTYGNHATRKDISTQGVSRYAGRADWAVRWALRHLHETSEASKEELSQLWAIIAQLVPSLSATQCARALSDGDLIRCILGALPVELAITPAESTPRETREKAKLGKRKRDSVINDHSNTTAKKRRGANEKNLPNDTGVVAQMADANLVAKCLKIVQHRTSNCKEAGQLLEAQCLQNTLSTSTSNAAKILRGSLASALGTVSCPLAPFLCLWQQSINTSASSLDEMDRGFGEQVLGLAALWLSRIGTLPGEKHRHEAYMLESLIARHVLLPSKPEVLAGQQGPEKVHRIKQYLQDEPYLDGHMGVAASTIFNIAANCCATSPRERTKHENAWLETLFLSLLSVAAPSLGQESETTGPDLKDMKLLLSAIHRHQISINRSTWQDIIGKLCQGRMSFNRYCYELFGTILEVDATAFLGLSDSSQHSTLDKILRDASTRQWVASAHAYDEASDQSGLFDIVRAKFIRPLLRSFAKAGKLEEFLQLWQEHYQTELEASAAARPPMSVWDYGDLLAELFSQLESTLSFPQIERVMQSLSSGLNDNDLAKHSNSAGSSRAHLAKALIHSLVSLDAVAKLRPTLIVLSDQSRSVLRQNSYDGSLYTSHMLSLLATIRALPAMEETSTTDHDLLVEESQILEQSIRQMNKSVNEKFSKLSPIPDLYLSGIFYWASAAYRILLRQRRANDPGATRLQFHLQSIMTLIAKAELISRVSGPAVAKAFESDPGLILLLKDARIRRCYITSYMNTLAASEAVDSSMAPGHRSRRVAFAGRLAASEVLVNDFVRVVDALMLQDDEDLAPVQRTWALDVLLELPLQAVPREHREKLLDVLMFKDGSTSLDAKQRLSLALRLLALPHVGSRVATDPWAFIAALKTFHSIVDAENDRRVLKAVVAQAIKSQVIRATEMQQPRNLKRFLDELISRLKQPMGLHLLDLVALEQVILLHEQWPMMRAVTKNKISMQHHAGHALMNLLEKPRKDLLEYTLTCLGLLEDEVLISLQKQICRALASIEFSTLKAKTTAAHLISRTQTGNHRVHAFEQILQHIPLQNTPVAEIFENMDRVTSVAKKLTPRDINHVIRQHARDAGANDNAVEHLLALQCALSNDTVAYTWSTGGPPNERLVRYLADALASSHCIEQFGPTSQTLVTLLSKTKIKLGQDAIEHMLMAIIRQTSPSSPALPATARSYIFSRLLEIACALVVTQRRHLRGRFHLVAAVVRGLLRCFFVSDQDIIHQARIKLPTWASGEPATGAQVNVSHADKFVRLVGTICEPSASATRMRRGRQHSMVDEIALAKAQAGDYMASVALEWAECNLKGRLVQGPDIRAALMPGMWSVLDCVKTDVLQAKADAQRAEKRAVVTALLAEWKRARSRRSL